MANKNCQLSFLHRDSNVSCSKRDCLKLESMGLCQSSTLANDAVKQGSSKPRRRITGALKNVRARRRDHDDHKLRFLVIGDNDALASALVNQFIAGLALQFPQTTVQQAHGSDGVTQTNFQLDGTDFELVQASTDSCEKAASMMNAVTALIMAVSLTGYNEYCELDGIRINRMQHAIENFNVLCNSKAFLKSSFMIFFTDSQDFEEKLDLSPIDQQEVFADFRGDRGGVKRALQYFSQKFEKCIRFPSPLRTPLIELMGNADATTRSFLSQSRTICMTKELVRSGFITVKEESTRDDSDADPTSTSQRSSNPTRACGVPVEIQF
jgi:hypothetical protein